MSKEGHSKKYLPNQEALVKWTEGTLLESLALYIQSSSQIPLPRDIQEDGLICLAYLHTPRELRTSHEAFKLSWNNFKENEPEKHRQAEMAIRMMGTNIISSRLNP
ncbi:MAG: hypothetical protein U1E78_01290 [Gammaproteobacteria bacterium]